jgi:uncharacterized membrane protein
MGIFAALTMLLAFMFAALAVDSGRLWSDKRELQTVTDIAALEAANSLGCGGGGTSAMVAAAQAAAGRNSYTNNVNAGPNSVVLGGITDSGGTRVFSAGSDTSAVRVTLAKTVPASLILGGLFGNTTTMTATATARNTPPQGSLSVGSALLRVNTTANDASLLSLLFGNILGGSLVLDAVSYQGLASTNISLLDLVHADASVGTVKELLDSNIKVSDLLGIMATAVNNSGVVNASVTAAMSKLIAASVNNLTVKLGDVISVASPDSEAAANAKVNLFDLISTGLIVANGSNALTLPLAVNIPGVAQVNALVKVIQLPQIAVGPPGQDTNGNWCTQARTAQISVAVSAQVGLANLLQVTNLVLNAKIAQGESHLISINAQPGQSQVDIGAQPGIATLTLTNSAGGPAQLVGLSLLGLPIVSINLGLNLPATASSASTLTFDVDPLNANLPLTQTVSSGLGNSLQNALGNPNSINVSPTLLGLPLNVGPTVTNIVNNIVAPLLGAIGSLLLDPLLHLIGVQVGVADVQLIDLQTTGSQLLI